MYKVSTLLKNFRYLEDSDPSINKEKHLIKKPVEIEWFFLEAETLNTRCFTNEEQLQFIDFVIRLNNNFEEGRVNYHSCDEISTPMIFPEDSSVFVEKPEFLILSENPRLALNNKLYRYMDIVLTNENGDNLTDIDNEQGEEIIMNIGIPFDVVGRVVKW